MKITLKTNDKHNLSKDFLLSQIDGSCHILDPITGERYASIKLATMEHDDTGEPTGFFLFWENDPDQDENDNNCLNIFDD